MSQIALLQYDMVSSLSSTIHVRISLTVVGRTNVTSILLVPLDDIE